MNAQRFIDDRALVVATNDSLRLSDAHCRRGLAQGRLAAVLLGAALATGCATEPWVKPYERERLADPLLKFSRDSLPDKHREHVFVVREGSRGATGVQGGGCGCN